jgi:hypothetical protein
MHFSKRRVNWMASYSIGCNKEAAYSVSENGVVTVSVRSVEPINPRAVYAGTASLLFRWVHTGKTTTWQFTPTLLNSTPMQFTQIKTEDGQSQITTVQFSGGLFPATGIIQSNVTGQIMAPAIHFDLPFAYDLWVILLRSPQAPLKLEILNPSLNIKHGSAQASLQVSSATSDEGDFLRAYASVQGEGYKRVYVSLKRSVDGASIEESLGEVADGMGTFSWKPFTRSFDLALVTCSSISASDFAGFLEALGAQTNVSVWNPSLQNSFLLNDGPTIGYTLSLKGDKGLFRHDEDKTQITLKT